MFYKLQENSNSSDSIFISKINKFAFKISKEEIDKKNVIYTLIDPNTFEIRYVGLSGNIIDRIDAHLDKYYLNSKENPHKTNWTKYLLKKDQKPIVVIIEEYKDYNDLYQAEIDYISYCKSINCNLLNATSGGDGARGYILTKEQRIAIAEANRKYRFTEEEIDEMTNMYKCNMTYEEIAKEMGRGERHLIRDLIQENDPTVVSRRRSQYRKFSEEIQKEIVDLHYKKYSINEIAKKFNTYSNTVKKCLEDNIDNFIPNFSRAPKINLNEKDLFRIVLLRYLGVKFNRIAELFECDRGTITSFLRKQAPNLPRDILGYKQPKGYKLKPEKVKIKKPRFTDEQILEMIDLHHSKISFTKIAIKFKSTKKLIKKLL
jgi:hypothetical protein